MQELNIKAFSTEDNTDLANVYYANHIDLLETLNVAHLFYSANKEWLNNKKVFGIIIQNKEKTKTFGGARIEIHDNPKHLPIYHMLEHKWDEIDHFIDEISNYNYGEIVGVWKSLDAKKHGVSTKLIMRGLFALLKHINVDYVFGLSSFMIFKPLDELGATKITHMGNEGLFEYTERKIKAAVYHYIHQTSLKNASEEEVKIMKEIHTKPFVSRNEKHYGKEYKINYDFSL